MSAASNGPAGGLRVEFTSGGAPDDPLLAGIVAVLTRPIVVIPTVIEDEDTEPAQSSWVRAARLEGIVHGRRITSREDLSWRGSGRGSA